MHSCRCLAESPSLFVCMTLCVPRRTRTGTWSCCTPPSPHTSSTSHTRTRHRSCFSYIYMRQRDDKAREMSSHVPSILKKRGVIHTVGGNDTLKCPSKTSTWKAEARGISVNLCMTWYGSVRHDVTHTLQRCAKLSVDDKKKPLWLRADERFFWNMVRQT